MQSPDNPFASHGGTQYDSSQTYTRTQIPVGIRPMPSNHEVADRTANITRGQEQVYRDLYVPVQRALIDRLEDRSEIEDAKTDSRLQSAASSAREDRNLNRFGLRRTALQQRQASSTRSLRDSLNYDDSVNNARLETTERNQTLRDNLISLGRGVEASASDAFSGLAAGASDRIQAGQINDTNTSNANRQQNTQLGTTAILAYLAYLY